MKPYDARPAVLTAVAGGILAGAVFAVKRPKAPERTTPVPLERVLHLPVARPPAFEPAPPVIYEAHVESPPRRRWWPWLAGAAVAIVAAAIALFSAMRPQISAAASPSIVDGSPGFISYSAAGSGSIDLTLDSASYHHTQSLQEREGIVTIAPAALHAGNDVLATFRIHGPLGVDARVVLVHVLQRPRPLTRILPSTAPVIRTFALSASAARGGEAILARYDTNATSGTLRLVDASGAIWTNQAVRGRGQIALPVPRMHADTPFIIEMQARRNGQTAIASAGFVARAVVQPRDPLRPPAQIANFRLPSVMRAGTILAIAPPQGSTQAAVALSAADGSALSATATERNGRMLLHVPKMSVAQQTFATLTYQRGKGKETLIKRVTIVP